MPRLVILGASGHALVAADIAVRMGCFESIQFLDQSLAWARGQGLPFECVGTCDEFEKQPEDAKFFVGYGGSALRQQWTDRIATSGRPLATLIHPSSIVSDWAEIGDGCVVCAQAVVNPKARLGVGVIVNTAASVDHHCVVGAFSHVCPGARLAGNVIVGEHAWVGIGSSVIQSVRIGDHVTVGAGAAVVRDVDARQTVAGVPARPLAKK